MTEKVSFWTKALSTSDKVLSYIGFETTDFVLFLVWIFIGWLSANFTGSEIYEQIPNPEQVVQNSQKK